MNNKAVIMLKKWIDYSIKHLYICPNRPDLICYGSGYDGWGIQTHQKALAAFAIIATNKEIDTSDMKTSREQLLEYSLKMFRFMLESHLEGSYQCTNGVKWGHTWISVLGTERAMHAIEELLPYANEADKALFQKVMISEANWLLDHYKICAGPVDDGNNRPESNIWNGAFLHRVAAMYPQSERAEEYKCKGTAFLVNGISHPEDEYSDIIYDGKPASAWYVGNNFYDTYALDHHGYLNIGYMVICISNIAMYHFSCKKMGYNPPKALYHRADKLWQLIKAFVADDGRLIRIGGDTRIRYCYCQDYLLPSLMFARDVLGDKDSEQLEDRLVDLFYKEFSSNGDGSFLSDRCKKLREISPLYYTRLESDKAAVLSMLINWSRIAGKGEKEISTISSWNAPSHGAAALSGSNRFASWAFHGASGMIGLCIPKSTGEYAEWYNNLAADIMGSGCLNKIEVLSHNETVFDGGFLVTGEVNRISDGFLAEGQRLEITAKQHIVFAVLPDDMTVVVMQYAVSPKRIYVRSLKGINLNIPNDVYNDFSRTYYYNNGNLKAEKFEGEEKLLNLNSRWINVDDQLGIIAGYPDEKLNLYRPGKRQITFVPRQKADNMLIRFSEHLSCDVICTKAELFPHWVDENVVILDTAAIVMAKSSKEDTQAKSQIKHDGIQIINTEMTRSVIARGNDGKDYIVISNPSSKKQTVSVQSNMYIVDVINNDLQKGHIQIPPKGAVVLAVQQK